jgi:hypothetical protein
MLNSLGGGGAVVEEAENKGREARRLDLLESLF